MYEDERQDERDESFNIEETLGESDERGAERPEQGSGKKKSDVGIFVFLGVMAILMFAAIGFVIYICSGQATGCTCGQCS